MVHSEDSQNLLYAIKNDESPLSFYSGDNARKFLRGIFDEYDTLDADISGGQDAIHIDTAQGKELGRHGALATISRQTNEGDKKYRARIKSNFRAGSTGTRFTDTIQFAASILETDVSNVEFDPNFNGVESYNGRLFVPRDALTNTALTESEVSEQMNKVMPASGTVETVADGTFQFASSTGVNDPKKGFASDTVEGGTLAEKLG